MKKWGYKIVYVPHEIIENYNACYRVECKGKLVFPPAADKLGISLNDILISEKWREMRYRADGYIVEQAHESASRDARERYMEDPKYECLCREINVASKETLMELVGIEKDLFQKIVDNRPYRSIDELSEKIPSLKKELFERIKEHFWCITER